MRLNRLLRTFAFTALLGGLAVSVSSCKDDDTKGETEKTIGEVSGVVTDDEGNALGGVEVSIADIVDLTETSVTATTTTEADGRYTLTDVLVGSHMITCRKATYQTTSVTLKPQKFNAEAVATVNIEMRYAAAKITGTVLDARNDGAPLAGVKVTISETQTGMTDANGKYEIANLPLDAYELTFSLKDYATVTKKMGRDAFENNTAVLDVVMGSPEVLRGKTAFDLRDADKWYYSEYRGGGNDTSYPHWDWSTDYMAALDFVGAWQEQNEGTTLQIRNDGANQKNPVDLDVFDSYVYGSKLITEDNKVMTLQVRTHNADSENPAVFGVQVIDLSAAEPAAVKIGGNESYGSDSYKSFGFDLSDYVGKEVVIAVGIYRAKTGDYWKQLVLRRIAFSTAKIDGWNYITGTPVNDDLKDWKLTMEMVRSTMPHIKKKFSGVTVCEGDKNKDNRQVAYHSWRDNSHIAAEWSFVPRVKDPEPFAGEGYVIKTRGGGTAVNTIEPEAYLYAKFSIAEGSNNLTLRIRNFAGEATFVKITAIKNDGTVEHIVPASNTAASSSAAPNGCWKFVHQNGGPGNPDAYAKFVYDLSKFNGEDVVLVLGVYKGEDNGTESKVCIYDVEMN